MSAQDDIDAVQVLVPPVRLRPGCGLTAAAVLLSIIAGVVASGAGRSHLGWTQEGTMGFLPLFPAAGFALLAIGVWLTQGRWLRRTGDEGTRTLLTRLAADPTRHASMTELTIGDRWWIVVTLPGRAPSILVTGKTDASRARIREVLPLRQRPTIRMPLRRRRSWMIPEALLLVVGVLLIRYPELTHFATYTYFLLPGFVLACLAAIQLRSLLQFDLVEVDADGVRHLPANGMESEVVAMNSRPGERRLALSVMLPAPLRERRDLVLSVPGGALPSDEQLQILIAVAACARAAGAHGGGPFRSAGSLRTEETAEGGGS